VGANYQAFYFLLVFALALPIEARDLDSSHIDENQRGCWVWNNIDLSAQDDCDQLLLYQGDIRLRNQQAIFIKRGFNPFKVEGDKPIVLVVRLYDLVDVDFVVEQLTYLRSQWSYRGVRVSHLQIDYDSPASGLERYANYIAKLSAELGDVHLSVTGLSSWIYDNKQGLVRLGNVADHVAMQLYKSYEPHHRHIEITREIAKLDIPYRLGVTRSPSFKIKKFYKGAAYLGINVFIGK